MQFVHTARRLITLQTVNGVPPCQPVARPSATRGQALYDVNEAGVVLRLSRRYLYEQIRSGRLRSVKAGRARRVPASAIAEYVALLEQEGQSA
ncbi:helix-turn-helix domain-containing protein [Nonomuraea sp. KM90]|uniref:helix-turn-helix domain-containing protein n=1 Tax=Nonomuraea sp. KM90 TaxID=3457428 RepID=UPI003FCCE95C